MYTHFVFKVSKSSSFPCLTILHICTVYLFFAEVLAHSFEFLKWVKIKCIENKIQRNCRVLSRQAGEKIKDYKRLHFEDWMKRLVVLPDICGKLWGLENLTNQHEFNNEGSSKY